MTTRVRRQQQQQQHLSECNITDVLCFRIKADTLQVIWFGDLPTSQYNPVRYKTERERRKLYLNDVSLVPSVNTQPLLCYIYHRKLDMCF